MKKGIAILSLVAASTLLVGGAFAAYAVTDIANPFGIRITPEEISEDDSTDYVTLEWGGSTALSNLEYVVPGHIYKFGVLNLKSTANYVGVLSLNLVDQTQNKTQNEPRFINYLKLYLYEGAYANVTEALPENVDPLAVSESLGGSIVYEEALGTAAGKEYSVYVEYDGSAQQYTAQLKNDVVKLEVDWSAQEDDVNNNDHTIYFASNWDQCYLYTYNEDKINKIWPGVGLTKIGLNSLNQNIYQGVLLDGYEYMIFNNGSGGTDNQTANIKISTFDFTQGDLLFWRDDTSSSGAGYKVFDKDSDVTNYAINLGVNPGPILQAWDWNLAKVDAELDDIAAAGYKAIQISPLQPIANGTNANQGWYMLYQPVGFKVADEGENPLGTAEELTALTAKADAKGISIIVDVITNHLAKDGDNYDKLSPVVQQYEPTIYNSDLLHHNGGVAGEDDTYHMVRGCLDGLPDLQTENAHVQERVISMLKEYIDCGVKGFRFDAAKHIETPYDGYGIASNFWPNVIGAINEYGIETYNQAPYSYGEALGVGSYRSWSSYTQYIDVTDYGIVWQARENGIRNSDEGLLRDKKDYTVGGGEHAVLFGESHDNYLNGENGHRSAEISDRAMDMLYGWHISRPSSSAFYYARPATAEDAGNNTKIVVHNTKTNFKNAVVSAANKLHNDFLDSAEYVSAYNGCIINARQSDNGCGVYIACLDASPVGLNVPDTREIQVYVAGFGDSGHIEDGTYKNLVNNETVTVSNGYVTVHMVNDVAVLEKI